MLTSNNFNLITYDLFISVVQVHKAIYDFSKQLTNMKKVLGWNNKIYNITIQPLALKIAK